MRQRLEWKNVKSLMRRILWINDSPKKIALGAAIGVFWGIMPTFGFAILFSLPTALLFKANRTSAILATFVANPLTTPLFYAFGYKIGQLVLGHTPFSFSWKFLIKAENLLNIGKSLLIGDFILAIIIALGTYGLVLAIITKYKSKKASKQQSLQNKNV
ncbi:MAG: DUF2062 domain-containing protein [Candidatus Aerophobetes bacterium]|nr:DUF2062 domain-containing protein [Candidatus Aerophobetes bacterium]